MIKDILKNFEGDSEFDIKIVSNGRTGTSGQWTSATSQRWGVTSTNNLIARSSFFFAIFSKSLSSFNRFLIITVVAAR